MHDDDQQRHEPSSREWDADSTLGQDLDEDSVYEESTQSLSSSVLDYTYENGRRYHAFRAGQYFMPNDEHEQEGLELMHHTCSLILGGELYRAPIKSPTAILEIGTGTGIWAIDVADRFPGASVIATDLSPIQPGWVPPNLEFQVDDCESEWNFNQKFDFIHMRNLAGSIADWPKLLKNCYDHLKPGGWIEISTFEVWFYSNNGVLPENSATYLWQSNLDQAAKAFGREINVGRDLGVLLNQAEFSDVNHEAYRVPASGWHQEKRELGKYFHELAAIELEAMSLRLYTGVLGWPIGKLHHLLYDVLGEIGNPAFEAFTKMHYAYGRRPKT